VAPIWLAPGLDQDMSVSCHSCCPHRLFDHESPLLNSLILSFLAAQSKWAILPFSHIVANDLCSPDYHTALVIRHSHSHRREPSRPG
jgi:hypothetical protein